MLAGTWRCATNTWERMLCVNEQNTAAESLLSLEEIVKKVNEGEHEKITPDDLIGIAKTTNDFNMLPLLILALLPGLCNSSSADYWRGKYEAYKELHEKSGAERSGE